MLNKKRAYGVVTGVPGVGFEQDGKLFKPNGQPLDADRRKTELDMLMSRVTEEKKKTEVKPDEQKPDEQKRILTPANEVKKYGRRGKRQQRS